MQWVYMSHVTRKPVLGVCDQLRLKRDSLARQNSQGLEISAIASRDILSIEAANNKGVDQNVDAQVRPG